MAPTEVISQAHIPRLPEEELPRLPSVSATSPPRKAPSTVVIPQKKRAPGPLARKPVRATARPVPGAGRSPSPAGKTQSKKTQSKLDGERRGERMNRALNIHRQETPLKGKQQPQGHGKPSPPVPSHPSLNDEDAKLLDDLNDVIKNL